jgi:hypothetical protein
MKRQTMAEQSYTALEALSDITKAVADWKAKFRQGAHVIKGMGGDILWQPRVGTWGFFEGRRRLENHWNPFGRLPHQFRKNMIVEINPPAFGVNTNVQGVVATSAKGERWVLHQGRLHPPGIRITEEMFDAVTRRRRVAVLFSDNRLREYHLVANIDGPAFALQDEIASFVSECATIRTHYVFGAQAADEERAIEAAEGPSSPEQTGSYEMGGRGTTTAVRKHGEVWHALVREMDRRGIRHSNGRVGRFGPDLRTFGTRPVLFEIKSENDASDVQQGVGQLQIYEKLLTTVYIKVLVLPGPLTPALAKAEHGLRLRAITYRRVGGRVRFTSKDLTDVMR